MSHFSLPWNNDITLEALCPWITGLLGQDRYWHAQQVLEICFRRTGAETYILHLDRIWDAISFFVQLNEKAHESKLLASLALLQTFCEGTMRRLRGKCMDNTQWNTAWRLMQETNTLLCQVVGHQDWEISRPCLNMKLLDIDRDILSVLGEAQSDDESAKDTTLLAIMRQSMFHCDRTLYHAAKWRYAVLLYAVNSANCSMPLAIAGSIPHEIYTGWQQYSIRTLRKKAQENPGTYLASKRAEYTRQTTKQLPLTLYPVSNKLPAAPTFKRTILFIGDIRTGKSTFIETLTGKHTGTSEDIVSCTSAIEGHILRFGDSIVECFDTPGFNDSRAEMSNYSVVEQIGLFLRGEAKTPRRVHGVIFMINIKKAKATADFKQSLDILHAILGDDAWKNTCVVYTHGVGSEQRGARARDDRRLEKKHLSGLMSQFPLAGRNVKTFGLVLDYTNDELLDAEGDTDDEQDHDDDDSATNTRSETYSSSSEDDSLKPHVFRPVQKDQGMRAWQYHIRPILTSLA
jgi:GTP-binding protein EngB required for normal cell division